MRLRRKPKYGPTYTYDGVEHWKPVDPEGEWRCKDGPSPVGHIVGDYGDDGGLLCVDCKRPMRYPK